jgi:hypothetical protein
MTEKPENNSIKDKLLQEIQTGRVKMRPRWYFVLKTVLLVISTVLAVSVVLFVASFIIFIMRQTGVFHSSGFGLRGIRAFLISLPWLLVLIAILFIILIQLFVKRYSFGYRKPLLYTILGVVGIALLGGIVVAQTPFHRGLFEHAYDNNLPLAGGLYREYGIRRLPHNIEMGKVVEVRSNGFLITNPIDQTVSIITNGQTDYPPGTNLQVDDYLICLGKRVNETTFEASAIKEVDELPEPPRHRLR